MFPLSSFLLFSAISSFFLCAGLKPSALRRNRYKDEIVKLHNAVRAKVTPPAQNMKKMAWDQGLARLAQQSADEKLDKFEEKIHLEKFLGKRFPDKPHTVWINELGMPRNPSTPVYLDWRRRDVNFMEEGRWLLRPNGKPYHKAFGDTWVGENIVLFHERDGSEYYSSEPEVAGSVAAWSNVTGFTYGCHEEQKYEKEDSKFADNVLDNGGFVGEEFLQIVWAETSNVGCGMAQGIWQDTGTGINTWVKDGSCSVLDEKDTNCTLVTMIVCSYWPNVNITEWQRKRPYLASCEKCPECDECCAADQANISTDAPTTVPNGSLDFTWPNFAVVVLAVMLMTVGWRGEQ